MDLHIHPEIETIKILAPQRHQVAKGFREREPTLVRLPAGIPSLAWEQAATGRSARAISFFITSGPVALSQGILSQFGSDNQPRRQMKAETALAMRHAADIQPRIMVAERMFDDRQSQPAAAGLP